MPRGALRVSIMVVSGVLTIPRGPGSSGPRPRRWPEYHLFFSANPWMIVKDIDCRNANGPASLGRLPPRQGHRRQPLAHRRRRGSAGQPLHRVPAPRRYREAPRRAALRAPPRPATADARRRGDGGARRAHGARTSSPSRRKLAGQTLTPSGELRVTTNDTLLVHLMMPVLRRLPASLPGHPRSTWSLSNQALNLSKRDADIAIRATDDPPETLVGRRVATLAWAVYGRARISRVEAGSLSTDVALRLRLGLLGDQFGHFKAARFVRDTCRRSRSR